MGGSIHTHSHTHGSKTIDCSDESFHYDCVAIKHITHSLLYNIRDRSLVHYTCTVQVVLIVFVLLFLLVLAAKDFSQNPLTHRMMVSFFVAVCWYK